MSEVTCHMSSVKKIFIGQSGETSRWRVCYQRGLPRLVLFDHTVAVVSSSSVQTMCSCINRHYDCSFVSLSVQNLQYVANKGINKKTSLVLVHVCSLCFLAFEFRTFCWFSAGYV